MVHSGLTMLNDGKSCFISGVTMLNDGKSWFIVVSLCLMMVNHVS